AAVVQRPAPHEVIIMGRDVSHGVVGVVNVGGTIGVGGHAISIGIGGIAGPRQGARANVQCVDFIAVVIAVAAAPHDHAVALDIVPGRGPIGNHANTVKGPIN